jgi:Outer membrane protein beta-barrel domain
MKRTLLVLAVASLCAMPSVASAQVGLIGGLTWGSTPNNNGAFPGTLKANNGFAIGLGAQSGGPVGFGFNALFAQRGYTSSVSGYSSELNYIDVPFYLRLAVPNPVITPFAFVGPQISFELNCSGGYCPSGNPSTTYAGIIGAGLKFHILGGVSLQGRYVYGLTNLNYGTVDNTNNYQPRSFMLLMGFGL